MGLHKRIRKRLRKLFPLVGVVLKKSKNMESYYLRIIKQIKEIDLK